MRVVRWSILLLVIAGAAALYSWQQREEPSHYITVEASRGPIVRAVNATGTVNPVTTVQVGTYVSGPISNLYVDFNSPVKAGQLLAKIDPRPYAAQVALSRGALANAKAQLVKDKANLVYQKLTYQRDLVLIRQQVISQDQLDNQRSAKDQAEAQIVVDQASIEQQEANLQQAVLNLNYTNIISPVEGTVVARNIDVGQTVAASFQTPTLFLVAKDLTKMQVDTNTSESDVGGIGVGKSAEFTVDAYPGRVFNGQVTQVRQAPITVQNVVTYDVVVAVANPELTLLPGMTANVSIILDRRADVLRIPLAALHFSPRHGSGERSHDKSGGGSKAGHQDQGERRAHVWVLEGDKLRRVPIIRGLDDGNLVEVIGGDLHPDDQVVTDELHIARHSHSSPLLPLRPPH